MPLNTETCRKKKKATYLLLMAYYDYVKDIEYRAELRMIKGILQDILGCSGYKVQDEGDDKSW